MLLALAINKGVENMSKNAQKMQVYIDAVGIDRDIMRAALRPSVEFLGFCGGG